MPDLFSTDAMLQLLDTVKPSPRFLQDMFFGNVEEHTEETINFDVRDRTRRIAPFCSPDVPGRLVQSHDFQTRTFKPAYVKDKRVFRPNRALKRRPGEQFTGTLSPMARMALMLSYDLFDMDDMLNRRIEVMSSEAMRLGQVTVSGDNYPTVVVGFSRAAGHTVTLTGGNRWGQSGIEPLKSLETWGQTVLQATGLWPSQVVMDKDAFNLFKADPIVEKRLDVRRVQQGTMELGAQSREGGIYRGSIDGFEIYTYGGWYVNDAGSEVPILPANQVLMGAPAALTDSGGYQAFGAILDERAGIQAMRFFPKSWLNEDPSGRILLGQSAPLVVPRYPNSTFAAIVN